MKEEEILLRFEAKLQYIFRDISLLKMALTHKSVAYDGVSKAKSKYNERIEFLGDAILEHIISDLLYHHEPELSEGDMTKMRASIVCEKSLSNAMKRIEGHQYVYLGKCEIQNNGRFKDAIIADAFESVIGAIYIDAGFDVTNEIVLRLLDVEIAMALSKKEFNIDYKTRLQEILQKHGTVKIEYILIEESGPEHDKTFKVELLFNDTKIGEGIGKNKKQAEQQAAKYAYERHK
ncbi:MAG: ribonuclease III [Clostridia bacterium]|nr:ribonuclease III [Clostridia bacterium]